MRITPLTLGTALATVAFLYRDDSSAYKRIITLGRLIKDTPQMRDEWVDEALCWLVDPSIEGSWKPLLRKMRKEKGLYDFCPSLAEDTIELFETIHSFYQKALNGRILNGSEIYNINNQVVFGNVC